MPWTPGDGPLTIAGYSFGADIALSVSHPAADRWIVVAPPLAIVAAEDLVAPADPRPVTVIAAEHDQFNPPDQLRPKHRRLDQRLAARDRVGRPLLRRRPPSDERDRGGALARTG